MIMLSHSGDTNVAIFNSHALRNLIEVLYLSSPRFIQNEITPRLFPSEEFRSWIRLTLFCFAAFRSGPWPVLLSVENL